MVIDKSKVIIRPEKSSEFEEVNEEELPKYSATVTYDPDHGIFREYVYAFA